MEAASGHKAAARRPKRGELLEVEIESLAYGGRGVARTEGLRRLRRRSAAGRPRPRRGDESQEALRRGAHGRAAEPEPRPRRRRLPARRRALPRRPLAGPRLRAPARAQERPGRRGAAADRRARGLRAGADRPGHRAVALPQQARVLLRRRRRPADARLPRPRPLGPDRRRRRLPPRLRGRQQGPQRGPRLGAAGIDHGLRRPLPQGDAAQPRRPRGLAHGPDPDPPGHHPRPLPANPRSTCTRRSRATAAAPTARPGCSARSACARSSAA